MPSRHRSRERALQMIFQWDLSRAPAETVMEAYWDDLLPEAGAKPLEADPFANELLQGVVQRVSSIDDLIRRHTEHWRLERMPAVDRNILRMAVYELLEQTAAPAVIINEALEIGRRFSGDESARFLNGVLDAIRRSLHAEKQEAAQSQSTS